MRTEEQEVRDRILAEYPDIWNVCFSYHEGVVVKVKARPNTTPCIVSLSRLIASLLTPSCYTIEIHFFWDPIRYRVLFGPKGGSHG